MCCHQSTAKYLYSVVRKGTGINKTSFIKNIYNAEKKNDYDTFLVFSNNIDKDG